METKPEEPTKSKEPMMRENEKIAKEYGVYTQEVVLDKILTFVKKEGEPDLLVTGKGVNYDKALARVKEAFSLELDKHRLNVENVEDYLKEMVGDDPEKLKIVTSSISEVNMYLDGERYSVVENMKDDLKTFSEKKALMKILEPLVLLLDGRFEIKKTEEKFPLAA